MVRDSLNSVQIHHNEWMDIPRDALTRKSRAALLLSSVVLLDVTLIGSA